MKKILGLTLCVCIIFCCKKELVEEQDCGRKVSVHILSSINKHWISGDFELTMDTAIIEQFWDTISGNRTQILKLNIPTEDWYFRVWIFNYTFQNPPLNGIKVKRYSPDDIHSSEPGFYSECNSPTLCDNANIFLGQSHNFYYGVDDSSSYVEILECDTAGRVISGIIKVKLRHDSFWDEILDFSSEFNNLCYEVRNY